MSLYFSGISSEINVSTISSSTSENIQTSPTHLNSIVKDQDTSTVPSHSSPKTTRSNKQTFGGGTNNLYTKGQCTFYAFARRQALHLPVNNGWGHAKYWANSARNEGYTVDRVPRVGAILVSQEGVYGHVAIVEKVREHEIVISEMNYKGPFITSERVVRNISDYEYIH